MRGRGGGAVGSGWAAVGSGQRCGQRLEDIKLMCEPGRLKTGKVWTSA